MGVDIDRSEPLDSFTFAWSVEGAPAISALFGVPAGTYSVTVTNSGGCELIAPFTIASSPAIVVEEVDGDRYRLR